MLKQMLGREEIEPSGLWWLEADYRGGVEKRIGWRDLQGYWFVVAFRDGTRTPFYWGTNNEEGIPSEEA